MNKFFNSFIQAIKRIALSFTKESILAGFFFFLVLCSWYILRPVRNEMAVQNSEVLPYLLGIGALVMLLLNPVYSWLASRKNLRGVLIGCYSFFISNLLGFIILLQFFDPSSSMSLGQILPEVFFYKWQFLDPALSISLSQIFYIWCNVYSFFVVSIFWVVIINLFRGENAANVFGVIAAGGSLGAYLGSEISKQLASTFNESGIIFFTMIAIVFLCLALSTGLVLMQRFSGLKGVNESPGGSSFDAIKNLVSSSQIRSIGLYMYLWTALMTVHWITSVEIVDAWSSDGGDRIIFFSQIEQTVTVLTLFTQFFLTAAIIRVVGPKYILMSYGFLFTGVFIGYFLAPTIGYVFVVTIILRLFEYGINKPTRELIFSYLKKVDRYKSSVFVDTFLVRLGDFSGSGFILISKSVGVAFSQVPLLAIPFAGCVALLGLKIPPKEKIQS
jgi:AAA family ATP:ADP antiporter|tara:strand:- start:1469 stop:2800 length:1332 start_codon:yes stop_codon:yes gene_type:complete